MISCIHGRPAADPLAGVDPAHELCLDCEEIATLRALETTLRKWRPYPCPGHCVEVHLDRLDDIRRRKGIGALGHPETRDLEGR